MAYVYSIPVDDLIDQAVTQEQPGPDEDVVIHRTDVVIVGSGYGASVAALQVAGLWSPNEGRNIRVTVLERGREYAAGEFPNTLGELPGHVRFRRPSDLHPSGNPDALFDLRIGDDTDVLLGNGLGGGSLINANVASRPENEMLDERWPEKYRNGGLDGAFAEIERLLGVNADTPPLNKVAALERLGTRLGQSTARARIAVTQVPPANAATQPWVNGRPPQGVGLTQAFCTRCGNCVTGCNVGAKNTLVMNVIPLAAERGAQFVTGANVLTVEHTPSGDGQRWRLRLQRTAAIRTPLEDEHFFVHADYVILAAGALGSTEILQRSQDMAQGVLPSRQLGRRFSTNGDGVGFSFGQSAAVDAVGTTDIHSGTGPGPTIAGVVRGRLAGNGTEHPYTLQEAAVPGALVKLFGELTTIGAQLGRLGDNELPAWFANAPHPYDPLAYNPAILPHNQMLLMMTDDRSLRTLSLSPPAGGAELGVLMRCQTRVNALSGQQKAQANAGLAALDARLSEENLGPGFDGGQYVANPMWRLLPEAARGALGGTLPGGRTLTVHPLGGCAMGDSAATGVVNADCQVFARDGGLIDGLYVMDGAVLPTALATNPFLTIAALAWMAGEALAAGPLANAGWQPPARPWVTHAPAGAFIAHDGHGPGNPARLILREQMIGRLRSNDPNLVNDLNALFPYGERLLDTDGMILRLTLDPIDVHGQFASLHTDPVEVDGQAELFLHPQTAALVETMRPYGAPPLHGRAPVATGTVRVTLLQLDAPASKRMKRAWRAFRAYLQRRSLSFGGGSGGLFAQIRGFINVALMHANYRQFRYEVALRTANGGRLEFVGRKNLRWQQGEARVWDALLNLPVRRLRLTTPGGAERQVRAHLRVDAGYMLDEGLIQVEAGHFDMIEAVVSSLSFVAWFARCLLQTCFWEFGSPDYPDREPAGAPPPPPLEVAGQGPVAPVILPIATGPMPLELVRYPQPGPAEPVLLVHGLAQGSSIFNTRRMDHNMARYFFEQGYDVWLVDYRLSNRLGLPLDGYAIDAIGAEDMATAVRRVYVESNQQRIKVFAHCVGAIGIQMALLRGELETVGGADMVESLCFNAIHPWVMPSAANLVRLKLGTFAREWITDDLLDPILHPADADSPLRSLMDRLAFSVARIGEQPEGEEVWHGKEDELDNGICDRLTFFYGRMWRHENIEDAVHDHWNELVGPAPAEVYQQLYYLIERQRILDDAAENTYLREQNILDHWRRVPTLFIHGDRSDVFNPYSATRSAIRLNKIFRDFESSTGATGLAPVRLRRYPGMGHMDPILGRTAHTSVYPEIAAFFAAARAWRADPTHPLPPLDPFDVSQDPTLHARLRPEAGEVLRAAWIDGGRVLVRYWVEQFRFNTSAVIAVLDVSGPYPPVPLPNQPFRPDDFEEWFQWFDMEVVNAAPRRVVVMPPVHVPGLAAGRGLATILMVGPRDWSTRRILIEGFDQATRVLERMSGGVNVDLLKMEIDQAPDDDAETDITLPIQQWLERRRDRAAARAGAGDSLRFLLGSCRYPGTPVERDNADAVFGGMLGRLTTVPQDLVFFVGDQIYADAYATIFEADAWREMYHRSYIAAFNSPNMARLLASVPVHFAVDDHELVDNYAGHVPEGPPTPARTNRGPQDLTYASIGHDQVAFANGTARRYQSSAREERPVGNAPQPAADSLWYALDHDNEVNFPCFVLDTRFERQLRDAHRHQAAVEYPTMLAQKASAVDPDEQLDALLAWLSQAHGQQPLRPKFVFSGQIIAPLTRDLVDHPSLYRQEDGFFGYPATLRTILRHIAIEQIRNVVFVGGDLHFSCAARLEAQADAAQPVTVWQIVASGLHAPMLFANGRPGAYRWLRHTADWQTPTLQHHARDVQVRYQAEWLTSHRAHFVEVDVAPAAGNHWLVSLRAFDPGANQIPPEAPFDETSDQVTLQFA